jgi:hypothetical protein
MEDGGRQGETMENREPERTGSIHEELGEDETVKTVFGLLPAAPIITSVSYVLWRQRIRSRG